MASSIPTQTRAVDPFASFNSNTVNALTKIVTRGDDGLTDYNALQVTADSTSPYTQAVVGVGTVYKDDVMVSITSPHTVNFEDSDHYASFGTGFNETGYYYIILDYTYAKSRPAPSATIKILKPSQISYLATDPGYFFLKAVKIINAGGYQIDLSSTNGGYRDFDPDNPDNKREYTPFYFGVETGLPTFLTTRDVGRLVYDSKTNVFWFGASDRWVEGVGSSENVIISNIDTSSVWTGCICYIDSGRVAQPAIASSDVTTKAEIGATVTPGGNRAAVVVGTLSSVRIESGISITTGDPLYLSTSEAGTVTNIKPDILVQDIGRALSSGDDSTSVNIMFIPRTMVTTSIRGTIETTDWVVSDSTSEYQADIDISDLDSTSYVVATSFFANDATISGVKQVFPSAVQLIIDGTGVYSTLRVFMPIDTEAIHYNISK